MADISGWFRPEVVDNESTVREGDRSEPLNRDRADPERDGLPFRGFEPKGESFRSFASPVLFLQERCHYEIETSLGCLAYLIPVEGPDII